MKAFIHLLALLSMFFVSCKKENRSDCFKSMGEIITETREIVPFDTIYVQNNINVLITVDTVWELKVEAGENLMPKIITEVKDGKLTISNSNRCNFVRSYKKKITVFIKLPYIKGIETDGDGVIKSTNTITGDAVKIKVNNTGDVDLKLDVNYVLTYSHGSGDVILSGMAESHRTQVSGTGFIRCAELDTHHSFVLSSTTGNTYVHATKALEARILGSGNIYYSGNPTDVKSETTGSGQLIEEK